MLIKHNKKIENKQRLFEDFFPKLKKTNIVSLILSIVFIIAIALMFLFCPAPVANSEIKDGTIWIRNIDIMCDNYDQYTFRIVTKTLSLTLFSCFLVLIWFMLMIGIRYVILFFFLWPKFYKKSILSHLKFLANKDIYIYHPKVAYVQPVCDDFLKVSFLKTMDQTYDNIDFFIVDDGKKEENFKQLQEFVKEVKEKLHKNITLIKRPLEFKKQHPSKIGNLYYFVSLYGDQYDYICESDASSILSSNFIECGLKYFFASKEYGSDIPFVIGNGDQFATYNLFSKMNSILWQFTVSIQDDWPFTGYVECASGWATIYQTRLLKTVPIEKVECSVCDTGRGRYLFNLDKRGLFCPLIFGGKVGPQDIKSFTSQRTKWEAGHAVLMKRKIYKFKDKSTAGFINFVNHKYNYRPIFTFFNLVLTLAINITIYCLNYLIILMPVLLFVLAVFTVVLINGIILAAINRFPFWAILVFAFSIFFFMWAIQYDLFLSFAKGYLKGKSSSSYVIPKKPSQISASKAFKLVLPRLIAFAIILGIFIAIYYLKNEYSNKQFFSIIEFWIGNFHFFIDAYWVMFVLPICAPLLLWIISMIISRIPIKKGFTDNQDFDVMQKHFLYKFLKRLISKETPELQEQFNKVMNIKDDISSDLKGKANV